jgi:hypothetical protein
MYNNIIYVNTQKTNKISPNPLDTGFKNMYTSTYLKKKKKIKVGNSNRKSDV